MTENVDKENEPHNHDLENSQNTVAIQPASKLQRLKRSLSFKTIIRSRSVDNFYMKSSTDSRLPPDFLTDPAPPSPPLPPGSPVTGDQSPSLIPSPTPSPNPSLCSRSPTLTASPSLSSKPSLQPRPVITHCFQEHIFRRPTSCQLCKNAIVGNSKQALRCKTCKMGAHLWCSSELSQQPCYGKVGLFKRNLSSPLLINDQLGAVKEAPAPRDHGKGRVDPVYELLRYGTSLAQMSRCSFGSLSESPTRSVGEGGEENEEGQASIEDDCSIDPGEPPAPEIEKEEPEEAMSSQKAPKRIEVHSIHTYVALFKFLPQEPNDLELQPGDRVQVTDDSNEEWWKGKCGDKVGFFPANFVQRVRPGERVWRVTQGSQGNREMGHMAVKESQICVGKSEDGNAYLKLSSGKKRGLVSCDSLEEI